MATPGVDPHFADPNHFDGKWPPDWDDRQQLVVRRDDWECTNCGAGKSARLVTIPEQPIEQGGTFELSNLITLCEECKDKFQQSTPSEHETSQTPQQSDPERDHTSSQTPEWNGQPTADDSLYRADAPAGSPAAKQQRRQREQRHQNEIISEDQEELGWLSRLVIAGVVGMTMTGTYILVLATATLSFPAGWDIWPLVLGLPVVGMLIGVWWRLSTAVAVGLLAPFYLLLQPFAPPGTAQEPTVWIPLVVPTLGIAYGLASDYFDFSLRDRLRRPQILD
jgi:hypothetical protein